MTWSEEDLKKLKEKGLKITDSRSSELQEIKKPKIKIVKISVEKKFIELSLDLYKYKGLFKDYVSEFRFDKIRRFRFDWAIPELKIAIEYEGVFSKKSRHTTLSGYSTDIVKYNLALVNGWRVLRYTAKNYQNFKMDLIRLLNIYELETKKDYCHLLKYEEVKSKCEIQCDNCLKTKVEEFFKTIN